MTIDHERTAPDDDTPAEGESLDTSDNDIVDIEDLDTDETTEDVEETDTTEDVEETDTTDDVLDDDDLDTDEAVEIDEDPDVETATEDFGETADVEDFEAVDEDETEAVAEVDPVADAAQGYFERTDATDAPDVTDEPDVPDVPDELEAPEDTPVAAEPAPATFATDGPFLPDAATLQQRWDGIQIGFVDEPLEAVENAGDLVAEVLDELTSSLAARREELESHWRGDADISTEDLRVVFQAYRALFRRIVL